MKNIHLLPTDKPSRLFYDISMDKLVLASTAEVSKWFENKHIYITNDEEIKEGDWYIENNNLGKCTNELWVKRGASILTKKIILTTDPDLINDGVQSIDDEFLEWFVKNPSCEEVEVKEMKCTGQCWKFIESDYEDTCTSGCELKGDYKIIVPKEEAKQYAHVDTYPELDKILVDKYKQETLEEAAEQYWAKQPYNEDAFIEGAKWQMKRMYSEEDMIKFAEFVGTYPDKNKNVNKEILHAKSKYDGAERTIDLLQIWFEQFTKETK